MPNYNDYGLFTWNTPNELYTNLSDQYNDIFLNTG